MTMRRRRALSRPLSTRKSIAQSMAAWKMHGPRLASSWKKSTTANACMPRSVIVRHWSSSANWGVPKLWGEDGHECSESWPISRSDDVCFTGSKRSGSLPVLIGLDEFQPAIPRQVALQQSLPLLRRPRTILQNKTSPYNDLSANGNTPLTSCLSPRVHSKPVPSSGIRVSTLISPGPCRLLRTPAGNRFFPTLSLQVFPRMLAPLIPSGGRVHLPVTSPPPSAFPKSRPWVGFPESPRKETSCGGCFEIVAIPYVPASWFARHPGLPHRCA